MDLKTLARSAGCIAMIALAAACAKKEDMSEGGAVMVSQKERAPGAEQPPTSATTAEQMGSSAATYEDGERKFIRSASARFAVKDVYVAALGIEDTVASHGGFVVENEIGTERKHTERHPVGGGKLLEISEYIVQGKLIVRVPSAKTQEFLRAIAGHIAFLDQRTFSAKDAQFELLRQQLDVLRNQEAQTELGQVVEEGGKLAQKAETISARTDAKAARDAAVLAKKEFEDQVAFSTIELKLYQPSRVLQTEQVDVESVYRNARPAFFPRVGEQLRGGWHGFLEFMLVMIGIWPVFLIGGAIVAVIWRIRRHRRKAPLKAE